MPAGTKHLTLNSALFFRSLFQSITGVAIRGGSGRASSSLDCAQWSLNTLQGPPPRLRRTDCDPRPTCGERGAPQLLSKASHWPPHRAQPAPILAKYLTQLSKYSAHRLRSSTASCSEDGCYFPTRRTRHRLIEHWSEIMGCVLRNNESVSRFAQPLLRTFCLKALVLNVTEISESVPEQ